MSGHHDHAPATPRPPPAPAPAAPPPVAARILRVDSVGGASGDMLLGGLIALGASPAAVTAALEGMFPADTFRLEVDAGAASRGMAGTRLRVETTEREPPHRHLSDIERLLAAGALTDRARSLAVATFRRLADAEARVHGCAAEDVHFHEVGAVDSIVDIAGACMALDSLGVTAVRVGPLPVGSGTIASAHGPLPLPAPATAALLAGHAIVQTDEPFELVTPTGAALLTTWQAELPAPFDAPARLVRAATALGHRELRGRANLLRLALLDPIPAADAANTDTCIVLECQVDDMTPECVAALTVRLLRDGALDVYTTAVQMKKQRSGILLTVLCRPAEEPALVRRIFTESTTFGIRTRETRRYTLPRHIETVATPYGPIRVKVGEWEGRVVTRAPEFDDCLAAAEAHQVPLKTVYEAMQRLR